MWKLTALGIRAIAFLVAVVMLIGAPLAVLDGDTIERTDDVRMMMNVISDIHMETNNFTRKDIYVQVMRNMAKYTPDTDVLLTCGDNTMNGYVSEYPILNGITAKILPDTVCIPVCGNHDIGNGEGDFSKLRPRFIRQYNAYHTDAPIDKLYYAREINGCLFIAVTNDDKYDEGIHVSDEMIEWIGAQLDHAEENGMPVIIGCHYPYNYLPRAVKEMITAHHNIYYFSGHLHRRGISGGRIANGRDDLWHFNLPRVTDYNEDGDQSVYSFTGLGVNVCVTDTDVTLNTYNFYTAKTVSSETVPIVK